RKNTFRELPEAIGVVRLVDGEPPHEHAADAIGPLAVVVLPRSSIPRGGGQHFDVVAKAQLSRQQAARMFGARRDLAAEPRGDERKLHTMTPRAWLSTTGPDGNSSRTSAAGLSERCRRASQPGSFSMR